MYRLSRTYAYALLALLVLGVFVYVITHSETDAPVIVEVIEEIEEELEYAETEPLGFSIEGREIVVHRFGNGARHMLFVGGIHGGYEWNTVVLADRMVEYFENNPEEIPEDTTLSIIPSLNPDGVVKSLGTEGKIDVTQVPKGVDFSSGRFNAHGVDLNRNFACKWAPESTWRGQRVSAGTEAFSEPEAQILKEYVERTRPELVVFWHSQGDAVFGSECEEGILPKTLVFLEAYAGESGYTAIPLFDAYPISGDAEGWLASIGIPALTVELKTRETIEFEKNLRGVRAVLGL